MTKLKILSYNIHKGFSGTGSKFILHELKKALATVDPDIVLLQEVVGHHSKHAVKRSDWPKEGQFEFLADTLWPHFAYGKNAVSQFHHHGNAILSRFPIIQHQNVNISTNRFESRGLLHAEVEDPISRKKFHILNVHLNLWHTGRIAQSSQIIQHVQKFIQDDHPVILGGDFNDWLEHLSDVFSGPLQLQEIHKTLHGHHAKSFPSLIPVMKLDRLYVRHFHLHHAGVLKSSPWNQLSDHLPLYAELFLT
jgi:endonuclease/exonuclease/phosphatase family metal-dependent hydrolase